MNKGAVAHMNLPPNVDWPDSRHSPCSALRQWCVGAAANNLSAWKDRVITSVVWEAKSLRGIWEAERQCSLKPEDQEAFESSRSLPALPSLELCIIFWRRYLEYTARTSILWCIRHWAHIVGKIPAAIRRTGKSDLTTRMLATWGLVSLEDDVAMQFA